MGVLKNIFQNKNTYQWATLGLLSGSTLVLAVLVFYCHKFNYAFTEVFLLMRVYPYIITFCGVAVILGHTLTISLFNYHQKYERSVGMFIATFIWGVIIVSYKLHFFNFNFNIR